MLLPYSGPVSNAERQRQFRERNPGYFNKYNARKKAPTREERLAYLARLQAAAADAAAAPAETAPPLLLPAPVELPVIPGANAIAATPVAEPLPLPVPIPAKIAA